MKFVSMIGTYHGERGRANVAELHAILERIQPDVIFLEAPATSSEKKFCVESLENVEGAAVIKYSQGRSVALEPVDLPTPDEYFFRRFRDLFNEVPRKSYDYHKLLAEHTGRIKSEGFRYLNSDLQSKIDSDMHAATIDWLAKVKNKEYSDFYELLLETNQLRDKAMVANIHLFCQANKFERAAFLVGAAHRKSIMEKTKCPSAALADVFWDYSGGGAW